MRLTAFLYKKFLSSKLNLKNSSDNILGWEPSVKTLEIKYSETLFF